MNTLKNELPPYVKVAFFMTALISVVFVLYIGSTIILPILFSTLFAILINPIVNFLHRHRVPRVIAIFMVLILSLSIVAGLLAFLITQASLLSSIVPKLRIQLNTVSQQSVQWISVHLHIPLFKVQKWFNNTLNDGVSGTTSMIGQTIISISGTLIIIFLIPVYMFMVLFYKSLILEFISKLFAKERHKHIAAILFDSKLMIQKYLVGLLLEFIIVSTLNAVGLLIIGVDFAILLGIIGGILNVIPYIGGIVAVIIPMVIALSTQSVHSALWVLVAYIIVQVIDNNILVHFMIAGKVKINALASIIAVLIFGAIWGIPGTFLSIPLTAILKVIFDRIEPLKPYGFILGDTMPVKEFSFFKRKVIVNTKES